MERRGLLAALAAALLFGVSGVVAADAFSVVEPSQVAQARSVMAAVLLGLVAWRRGALSPRGHLRGLAVLGALLAVVTITYYEAIHRLGVGPGVTIQFLGPVLVLIWMAAVQKRAVPGIAWGAALTAVAGTFFITEAWNVAALDPVGVAAGLGAAVTFAGYLVMGEYLGKRLPEITVAAYGFGVSALIWLAILPVEFPARASGVWPSLLWVGVLGTAVPFLLEIVALRRADPGRVGVVATAEPVVAGLTAWLVLGQALGGLQLLGMGMTVAGVASIQAITHSVAPDIPPEVV
jgi:drug/metabolite transporter (DMT)-like permease